MKLTSASPLTNAIVLCIEVDWLAATCSLFCVLIDEQVNDCLVTEEDATIDRNSSLASVWKLEFNSSILVNTVKIINSQLTKNIGWR